ncbi:MAG: 2-hydroxyacid dehydrogenase [Betaproteobacteria bacterium]
MKILFHFDVTDALAAKARAAAAPFEVACCPESSDAAFEAAIGASEVLWHSLKPVTAQVIARASKLRLIQKIGTGVNTIDLTAARERGIAVCNLPGANGRAVAEMALMLMLACLRRLRELDAAVRMPGGWHAVTGLQDRFGEIGGRTVGLVGFGAVPQQLAGWLAAMGANVVYCARSEKECAYERLALPELLARADIVSLHVPLNESTQGLMGASSLSLMKPGAILVNTARGGLVDEAALLAALESGKLGAAGLDVFADEPPATTHPLLALPNVVASPHLAWLTQETLERCLALAAENVRRLHAGEPLMNRVA